MAASTPSPAWLTSSAVVGCLVWQQQLLLISKVRLAQHFLMFAETNHDD
jgi:hypothetical protein